VSGLAGAEWYLHATPHDDTYAAEVGIRRGPVLCSYALTRAELAALARCEFNGPTISLAYEQGEALDAVRIPTGVTTTLLGWGVPLDGVFRRARALLAGAGRAPTTAG
jgi:hypothetical protein